MIDVELLKMAGQNISILDFSSLLGVPSGVILRNDHYTEDELQKKIPSICRPADTSVKLIRVIQKHTSRIVTPNNDLTSPADGIFSDSPDDILLIRTADCIPLFISDGKYVGLLHLGWRGIAAGIVQNVAKAIPNLDKTKAKVVIGPGIGKCCFEVSPEVALIFNEKYRIMKNCKYRVDLESMVIDELKTQGFTDIYATGACTYCEPNTYYSYRREGEEVRHLLSYISSGGLK
jgi:hypothetical protein